MRKPSVNLRVATLVCVLGLTAPGCGAAVATSGSGAHAHLPVALTPQDALLQQIVSSVQPSGITSATIGSPPENFQGGPSSWVTISIPPGDQVTNISDEWKSALVAGTFHDLSEAEGLPRVAGYTTPQGAAVIGTSDPSATDAAPTQDGIQSALLRVGIQPTSVVILTPGEGKAVVAAGTVKNAGGLLTQLPSPLTAVFGDLDRYAGTYLEIDDAEGVAYVAACASVDGSGVRWIRPDIATPASSQLRALLHPPDSSDAHKAG